MFELARRIASITKWVFSKNWDCPKISYKCHVFFISYLLVQYYLLPGAAAVKLCLSMISNIQSSRYRKKQHKIVWRFEVWSKKPKWKWRKTLYINICNFEYATFFLLAPPKWSGGTIRWCSLFELLQLRSKEVVVCHLAFAFQIK